MVVFSASGVSLSNAILISGFVLSILNICSDFKADVTNTDGVIPELTAWQTTENTENPDQSVSTATIMHYCCHK